VVLVSHIQTVGGPFPHPSNKVELLGIPFSRVVREGGDKRDVNNSRL